MYRRPDGDARVSSTLTAAGTRELHPGPAHRSELSLRELAARTNVSNPYLSQIERGLHEPSVRVLKAIATALNVSAETLLAQAGLLRGRRAGPGRGADGGRGRARRPPPHRRPAPSDACVPRSTASFLDDRTSTARRAAAPGRSRAVCSSRTRWRPGGRPSPSSGPLRRERGGRSGGSRLGGGFDGRALVPSTGRRP